MTVSPSEASFGKEVLIYMSYFLVVFTSTSDEKLQFVDPGYVLRFNSLFLQFPDSMIYPFHSPSDVRAFSDAQPLTLSACSKSNFCLFHTTPVFSLG